MGVIGNLDDSTLIDLHAAGNIGANSWGIEIHGDTRHNRFIGCKSCLNRRSGWIIQSTTANLVRFNMFLGCIARNNKEHGYHLKGAYKNSFIGCTSIDNGLDTNDTYDAFILETLTGRHASQIRMTAH